MIERLKTYGLLQRDGGRCLWQCSSRRRRRPADRRLGDHVGPRQVGPVMLAVGILVAVLRTLTDTPVGRK